jgi:transposase-like protein
VTIRRVDKAQVVEMYLAGIPGTKIAERFGVSDDTVYAWVRKSGHTVRPHNSPHPLTGEALEAVEMYVAGASTGELAERFGVDRTTIRSWVRKGGHEIRSTTQQRGVSGYRGVIRHDRSGRTWQARDGDDRSLGVYSDVEDAARAVDYHRLTNGLPAANFPDSTDETLAQAERWTIRRAAPVRGVKAAVVEALNCRGLTVDEVLAKVDHLGTTRTTVRSYLQSLADSGDIVRVRRGVYASAGSIGGEGPM